MIIGRDRQARTAGTAPRITAEWHEMTVVPAGGGRKWRPAIVLTAGAVLGALALASALVVIGHPRASSSAQLMRPSGIPASIPASLADLMSLSPVPNHQAPGFTLTDQDGQTLALSRFRGRAIVLEFMDPHCTDICPLVSQEFTAANHDLGPLAGRVAFVAVNVNPYHLAVSDVRQFSAAHQLTSIPSWHFFTGPLPRLREAWRAYDIAVQAPNPDADVVHTSTVFFIDPRGTERYVAVPMADHTASGASYLPAGQIASWGHGIALLARQLVLAG
jgi:cytochrome oxidase Cu insertion factor (SCO1/SenC/PrrC family)